MAASWTAPLSARYSFTSHWSRSTVGPVPPIRRLGASSSDTLLARTFQWPGGVSDFGPSAQNSAMTRPKSPWLTTSGA